jgi:hypothetical protein
VAKTWLVLIEIDLLADDDGNNGIDEDVALNPITGKRFFSFLKNI